eukprot:c7083_g1_i1.p1 GENE.c7083_g1_i1~~c7083_g1_i1.p1  ORF type:complete len:367 (-),score=104.16 c7083_g1_i1:140-1078(-)
MFDEEQNSLAENIAERELYLKRIDYLQAHIGLLQTECTKKEDELAASIDTLTEAYNTNKLKMAKSHSTASLIHRSTGDQDPDDLLSSDTGDDSDEPAVHEDPLVVRQREDANINKLKKMLGSDAAMAVNNPTTTMQHMLKKKSLEEGFGSTQLALQQSVDEMTRETAAINDRVTYYEGHLKRIQIEREGQLRTLEANLRLTIETNEKLKDRLHRMLDDRAELLETQGSRKVFRRTLINKLKEDEFKFSAHEGKKQAEATKLKDELHVLEGEKKVLYENVAQIAKQVRESESELSKTRATVENYRKMLAEEVE